MRLGPLFRALVLGGAALAGTKCGTEDPGSNNQNLNGSDAGTGGGTATSGTGGGTTTHTGGAGAVGGATGEGGHGGAAFW
jgi:hypothetical protein